MTLRVAIQMDAIASIDPAIETTFRLGLEAQVRGHQLWYYTPDKLSWKNGRVTARAGRLTLHKDAKRHYTLGKTERLNLQAMEVILLRQDPPFDMSYITTTYLLEKLHPKTLVVNNPASVRDLPEKLFPILFKKFMPPTLISADIEEIKAFRQEQKDIVIKPLYGHSGRAVFRLKQDDDNFSALMKELFSLHKEPWIIQRYLPEMKTGERRIIMIDGKFAAIAGRIPPKGATSANIHAGAKYVKARATQRQRDIADAIGPVLKEKGILFAGLDIIGDWLTEINITSPGSLAGIATLYGKKLEVNFWDAVEGKL
ncbi:MAG: glutathione synthase [Pseudomonadota bacterium]|nr:glutathione synthase [Pseudomonadota bacterium]MDE3036848.1 glutathione synthase [Pseudomonadota bacterium]